MWKFILISGISLLLLLYHLSPTIEPMTLQESIDKETEKIKEKNIILKKNIENEENKRENEYYISKAEEDKKNTKGERWDTPIPEDKKPISNVNSNISSNPFTALKQIIQLVAGVFDQIRKVEGIVNKSYSELKRLPQQFKIFEEQIVGFSGLITGFSTYVSTIPQVFSSIFETLESFPSIIQSYGNELFKERIGGVFDKIIDIFDKSIIKPFTGLFEKLAQVFVLLFDVLLLIVEKIITLPSCIFAYSFTSISQFLKLILPKWIWTGLEFIFRWFVRPFLLLFYYLVLLPLSYFLSKLTGRTISFDMIGDSSCFKFEIKAIISKMKNIFISIISDFSSGFGKGL